MKNAKKKIVEIFFNNEPSENLQENLNSNIKCGNSLFNTSFDSSNLEKENNFQWENDFKEVMNLGGFNVVIGNPPYVDIKQLNPNITDLLFKNYNTVHNRANLYAVFIERSLRKILRNDGILGFIIPNSILYNSSYSKSRELILNYSDILEIIRMPDKVFDSAVVETIILFLKIRKEKYMNKIPNRFKARIYNPKSEISEIISHDSNDFKEFMVNPIDWRHEHRFRFLLIEDKIRRIITKIEGNGKKNEKSVFLEESCDFSLGITPYDKYKGHTQEEIKNKVFHSNRKIDTSYKPLLSGSDITRYKISFSENKFIKYGKWLAAPRKEKFFTKPRIIVRQIISGKPPRIFSAYNADELYNTQIAFTIIPKNPIPKDSITEDSITEDIITKTSTDLDLFYILGILNSKLMTFYHKFKFLDNTKITFQKILIQNTKLFPIKCLEESKMEMLSKSVKNLIGELKTNEFTQMDIRIDNLVYGIYGLNQDEISIIEKMFQ